MTKSNELTLEQEFKLAVYKQKVVKLNSRQSRRHLIATLQQMMLKDTIIKYFIKNSNL